MVVQYPDVSHYQRGLSLRGAPLVVAKATHGARGADTAYADFRTQAQSLRIPLVAYHWLDASDPVAQARHCLSVVGVGTPLMVDDETPPIRPARTLRFVQEYRRLGGRIVLLYLPRWAWNASGRPDLQSLAAAGLTLVASDYSGSGREMRPYGGMTPMVLQFTDRQPFNGKRLDFNRYEGTLEQLLALLFGTPAIHHDTGGGGNPAGGDDEMLALFRIKGEPHVYASNGVTCRWLQSGPELTQLLNWGNNHHWPPLFNRGQITDVVPADFDALAGVLVGPDPRQPGNG